MPPRDAILSYQRDFYSAILTELARLSGGIRLTLWWQGKSRVADIMVAREAYCLELGSACAGAGSDPSDSECLDVARRIHRIQRRIKLGYNPINFDDEGFLQERARWVKWRVRHFRELVRASDRKSTYRGMIRRAYGTREAYAAFVEEQNVMDARCFRVTQRAARPMFRRMVEKQTKLSREIMARTFLGTIPAFWS